MTISIIGYISIAQMTIKETSLIEVWSGAYGYEELINIEGGVISELPSSEPLTESFFSKNHKPVEYYMSRFFSEYEVENIDNNQEVDVIKGLLYEVAWRPNTLKWKEQERWLSQIRWNESYFSEKTEDVRFIEDMEKKGREMNLTGEEYYISISHSIFSFNVLGIETEKLEKVESWFNDMRNGRFLRPGEKNTIIISAYVSDELGLSIGDNITIPLGGINEYNDAAGKRVDTRENYTLQIVGIISSNYQDGAIVDLNFLMEALKKNTGEMPNVLPIYNRLFIKISSENLVKEVISSIKSDYPDTAIIIRGKVNIL